MAARGGELPVISVFGDYYQAARPGVIPNHGISGGIHPQIPNMARLRIKVRQRRFESRRQVMVKQQPHSDFERRMRRPGSAAKA